jgi:hypothetical protein
MNTNTPNFNNPYTTYIPPVSEYNDINSTARTEGDINTQVRTVIVSPNTGLNVAPHQEPMIPNHQTQPIQQLNVENNYIPSLTCNQVGELQRLNEVLKSNPSFIVCPFCKETAITKSERKWSFTNLLCCVCFGAGPWIIFQALRKKDINCMDADHYCSKCGKKVSEYKSC